MHNTLRCTKNSAAIMGPELWEPEHIPTLSFVIPRILLSFLCNHSNVISPIPIPSPKVPLTLVAQSPS